MRRFFFVFNIIAVLSLLIQGGFVRARGAASNVIIEGTFITIWGDGLPGFGEQSMSYFLSNTGNDNIQLVINSDLMTSVGGPMRLNRQVIIVQGAWLELGTVLQVQTITFAEGEPRGPEGVYGPQPWVSILCKFSDYTDEPKDINYFMGMYSSDYPGLDHYWRQQSYDLANLEGSGAFGWYVLPYPRDHYVPGGNLDFEAAAHDCTTAADPYVDFTPYVGINMMFNAVLDCCAWGGSWYLCLDGICQNWRMTWEPPWGYENIGVIAHETGHGFGLPHSLGNCQQGYDNRWDVLSDVWSNGPDPIYGTMGQHTISYHKEMLGWITPEQIYTASVGTVGTVTLERLALPQTGNYLGVRIPIKGSLGYFYTLEVRQPTDNLIDYDKWLPGFAVIIHEVAVNRPEPAVVIDQDGDCNTADAGAMFTPGETYSDPVNGIYVSIDSATETGYVVTIRNQFTLMDSVEIAGVNQGYIGESIPFTATVSPIDSTTPITYTWEATGLPPLTHTGEIVDRVDFSWEETGRKAITVTASNDGGTVVDTYSIDIVPIVPIVSISGPAYSSVGLENIFTATIIPTDIILPITYIWQASGQVPITHTDGISDAVSYIWDLPGTQTITVTAMNIHGSTTDTFSLPVRMPPAGLEVIGPVVGDVHSSYTFTATVNPITTTVPLTYVWSVDDQLVITHTSGIYDTASFTWDQPGFHQFSISATNPAGSVVDTWATTIYIKVYLPISLRN
jgi:hypothetical protein